MSTYGGQAYVREQVRSILAQLPEQGRLIIRDDGSTDRTVEILAAIPDPRVQVQRGTNVGFVRSFLSLLTQAPDDADMVMLSDQDDIWLPDKIARAWAVIGKSAGTPTLYCSRLQLVDNALEPVGLSPDWPRPPSFQNALTENIVTGCTAALNPAALRLARQHGDPGRIHFHDWWLYLTVSAFGHVVFDRKPTILYRQHGNNAIGMGAGLSRYVMMLRFLRKTNWVHIMFNQIDNLRAVHEAHLPPDAARHLDKYFDTRDWRSIARLLVTPRRMRQTLFSDVLFRGLVAASLLTGRGLRPGRKPA